MTYRFVDPDRLRAAQIVLLFLAVVWGLDYLITPDWAIAPAMSVVEQAMPIPVWGAAFLTFGVLGLLGELWMELGRYRPPHHMRAFPESRWWVSYLSHAALLMLYATVGVGYALELVVNSHIWGCRAPLMMWAIAFGHWVFMSRRKNA